MPEDFREPRKIGPISLVFGMCPLLGIYLAFHLPSGGPVKISGVVQSAGSISVAKNKGGTRESASVLLSDGKLVMASVAYVGPLSPGDNVRVLAQRSILGPISYQVVNVETAK